MSDQKLFAFWKYDLFPFCLGAEVVKFNPSGSVVARGYEGYACFMPILILPLEEGQRRWDEICKLKHEHARKKKTLDEEYLAKVNALLR